MVAHKIKLQSDDMIIRESVVQKSDVFALRRFDARVQDLQIRELRGMIAVLELSQQASVHAALELREELQRTKLVGTKLSQDGRTLRAALQACNETIATLRQEIAKRDRRRLAHVARRLFRQVGLLPRNRPETCRA